MAPAGRGGFQNLAGRGRSGEETVWTLRGWDGLGPGGFQNLTGSVRVITLNRPGPTRPDSKEVNRPVKIPASTTYGKK